MPPLSPKALLTDVFGTVVDWRGSVTVCLESSAHAALNDATASIASVTRANAAGVSWADMAMRWREMYFVFTRNYDTTQTEFETIDKFFRRSLGELVNEFGVEGLWTDEQLGQIARVWRRLEPWGDSARGIELWVAQGLQVGTLSNANNGLLKDLLAFGQLPYTRIFGADDFEAYKPNPKVYRGAAERLGLETGECALVAAHLGDLWAARECGMRTIYVERRAEEGWEGEKVKKAKEEGWVDMWVGMEEGGFLEVATRLESRK